MALASVRSLALPAGPRAAAMARASARVGRPRRDRSANSPPERKASRHRYSSSRFTASSLDSAETFSPAAIRSIAFQKPAAIVDGNVRRVLSRIAAWKQPERAALWELAGQLARCQRPDEVNQALMELGALVCTPRAPRCPSCPLREDCAAAAHEEPDAYPARLARSKPRAVRGVAGVLWRRRPRPALLVLRRPSRGLLGGLWELPSASGDKPAELVRELRERTGIAAQPGAELGSVKHVFSHRSLLLRLIALERCGGRLRATTRSEARWCEPHELRELPLSKLMDKSLALAGLS